MAKRHLTRRQQWRIEKVQQERVKRTNQREIKLAEELLGGDFGEEQQGLVIAHFGVQVAVESDSGTIYHCYLRANLPPLVTGDQVIWRASNQQIGIVTALQPRITELCRTDSSGKLKPIASNVTCLAIVFAPLPTPYANLLDRYLIAAEHLAIKPLLIFNKVDLLTKEADQTFNELLNTYRSLNYQVLEVSNHYLTSIEALRYVLSHHTTVFVGQSGVGKSSLIKSLLPQTSIRIGDLSELTFKGTHTTTTAKLYHLPSGGDLIDSPGIREFALTHMDKVMIEEGFIEFRPFLGRCKFRNCQHQQEPGCALLVAVAEGKISPTRLASYRYIIKSLTMESDGYTIK